MRSAPDDVAVSPATGRNLPGEWQVPDLPSDWQSAIFFGDWRHDLLGALSKLHELQSLCGFSAMTRI
ncbi:hypothetical protein TIFTF001_013124 [Ficus carica]|uniref:Uncharacterized protein n=1 Tax=Ficus carica TaxID=3494 RepID=A0AA88D5P7_FICCA|nr:hypothetical protein TIFTF001_013124 [Ficus carica]